MRSGGSGLKAAAETGALAGQTPRSSTLHRGAVGFAALRVSNTLGTSAHPALAWNGRSWGLVYSDDSTNVGELYYRPLARNGASNTEIYFALVGCP